MRTLLSFVLCFQVSVIALGADRHEATVVKRAQAPQSIETGLNGKVHWKEGRLYLETPSGKMIRLRAKTNSLYEKLSEVAGNKNPQIEVAGSLSEGELVVSAIESTGGTYTNFLVSIRAESFREVTSGLKKIDGIDVVSEEPGDGFILVKSDFSEKSLKKLIRGSGFSAGVKSVEKNLFTSSGDE